MKNLVLILLLAYNSIIAQQIYPLETSIHEVQNNGYIKDTQNELYQYVGVWKGEWEGKTLTLDLRKFKDRGTISGKTYYIDKIIGERKIVNAQGKIEIDRIAKLDNANLEVELPEFIGIYPNRKGKKELHFYPKDMCDKSASLVITFLNPEKTKMHLKFHYNPSWNFGDCKHRAYIDKYGDFPMNFPKDIVLTKQ